MGSPWECPASMQYFVEQPGLHFTSCLLDFIFAWKLFGHLGAPLFSYLFYRNIDFFVFMLAEH